MARYSVFTLVLLLTFAHPSYGQSDAIDYSPFDPFLTNSRVFFEFDSYYFVAETRLYALRPGYVYSIPNQRHAMSISVPFVHSIFSGDFAGFENTTGIGDFRFTYTGIPYVSKDILGLQRLIVNFEVTAPTGNELLGRGVGGWVYKPGIAASWRADEAVHFFPQLSFQFSTARLNSLGGGDGLPDLEDPEREGKLSVLSVSFPAAFVLNSWDGWIYLSPEYLHTFEESTYFLFLRLDLGKMISTRSAASIQITRFIAGQPRLETLFRVRFNFFLQQQARQG